jgi:tetratricopeptide (TPR) repeat protein
MNSGAVELIDEGNALEEQGRTAEAMARYDAAVQVDPRCARAHLNRGNVLLADGRIDEARGAYQRAIDCDPRYAAARYNLGNLNASAGELILALSNYQAAIDIKPDFADAFVAMANALDRLGRPAEAIAGYRQALAIHPGYAEVHYNLGLLEMTQGRLESAAASFARAVELRPDYVLAHRSLARALNFLEKFDAAEASLGRALALTPDADEILEELVSSLLMRGKKVECVQVVMSRLERPPSWPVKMAFAACVSQVKFTGSSDPAVRAALRAALSEPWGPPFQLSVPALSMIMLDQKIAAGVRLVNERWPARVPKDVLLGDGLPGALAADRLLHALLETVPVATPEFERFLTAARSALLEGASGPAAPSPADMGAIEFYAALARQCFINEYVFDLGDAERLAAEACRAKLIALLDTNAAVPPLLLLAAAACFPLYSLPEPQRLLAASHPPAIAGVLQQQVREPLEERALRSTVRKLTPISAGVSERVREQYEENPYPRWVKLPRYDQARHFNESLRLALPLARFTPLADDSNPEMLIAGCGTGSHSIFTALWFRNLRLLAVDLSLSSLSYAIRQTRAYQIANIEYAQADIMQLGTIGRTFDIIASDGVLHHLADPFAGWRILLSLLRPGGFMHLGFYSEAARRHIVAARQLIATRGYAGTPDDIRRLRREVRDSGGELQPLTRIPDFYSMSDCRDLLFHVQEHRLMVAQIKSFLEAHGLAFLGFELLPAVLHKYRVRFPDDRAGTNLDHWALFEAGNPDTFIGMYQFWIQKPRSH